MKTLAGLLVLIAPLLRASPGSCPDHDFLIEAETVRTQFAATTKADKAPKSPAPAPTPAPKKQSKQERTARPAPPAHLFM